MAPPPRPSSRVAPSSGARSSRPACRCCDSTSSSGDAERPAAGQSGIAGGTADGTGSDRGDATEEDAAAAAAASDVEAATTVELPNGTTVDVLA